MPISHKYKLIFIHIPKCAGISVWHALDLTISDENLISVTPPILQHLLPNQLKYKYIDKKTWESYSKITIIRNPYDRVISDYFWMKDNPEAKRLANGSFDDFLTLREDIVKNNKYDQDVYFDHFYPMHFYFEGVKYDQVIRFENIAEGYEQLRKTYNIQNELPRVNESNRKNFTLNKSQQDRIYNLYKKDFIQFGYERKYEPAQVTPAVIARQANGEVEMNSITSLQPHSNNIIEPLQKNKIQVFWAKEDMFFSESNSQTKVVQLEKHHQNVSFNINSGQKIKYIRFDIGNQVGFLNIHQISIQAPDESRLWKWNPNDIVDKENLLLIEDNAYFESKTIQLSFTDDPQFVIQLPENSDQELVIEISLSSLSTSQIRSISKLIKKPLSFFSMQDLLEFQTEKEALKKDIGSLNDSLARLKASYDVLDVSVDAKDKILKEREEYKATLENELKFKNDLIAKQILEKEKFENLFIESTNKVKTVETINFEKEKEIIKKEAELKQLLADFEKQQHHIALNKEKLDQQQIKYDQLTAENKRLVSKNEDQIQKSELTILRLSAKGEELEKMLLKEKDDQKKWAEEKSLITSELIKDKAVLTNEMQLKNESIHKLEKKLEHVINESLDNKNHVKNLQDILTERERQLTEVQQRNNDLDGAVNLIKQEVDSSKLFIANLEKVIELKSERENEDYQIFLNEKQELQNQLRWYKDTFETRSIFGIIKDRIYKFFKVKQKNTNNSLIGGNDIEKQLKWYRDTYENRSIWGIIKDRIFKFLREGIRKKQNPDGGYVDSRIQWYKDTYENRRLIGIIKDRVLKKLNKGKSTNVPVVINHEITKVDLPVAPTDIQISVIIPTYNRSKLLPSLLESWKAVDKVTKYKYEIIFSDDGSSDGSIEILRAEKQLPIRIIENAHGGPAKARNSAILQARGEKLLIIGDDIFPNPEMLNQHYEKLLELPVNKAVLGEVVWHRELEINVLMKHITELGQEQFSFNAFNPYSFIDFRHFYTCNISIDKAFVLTEKIIFDESFYKVNFEDVELGYRLAKKGMEIFYFPDAVAEHHHSYKSVKAFCKRQETCGEMAIVFKKLHGEEVEWVTQVENISNLWNTYLSETADDSPRNGFINYILDCCQRVEDDQNIDKKSVEPLLSDIYRGIFRFHYEKGVAYIKFNPSDADYDKVFYRYFWSVIADSFNKLKEITSLPEFKQVKVQETGVRLVIQVESLEQVAKLKKQYGNCVDYLWFELPSEANRLTDTDFVYTPETNYFIHPADMNQIVMFLQTYPTVDLLLLSFGLYDLPEIGLSANLKNNLIRRVSSLNTPLDELQSVKIIRLIGETAEKVEKWNSIVGNSFEYNAYGFLFKNKLPAYHPLPFELTRSESSAKRKTVFVLPTFLAVGGVEKNTIEIINQLKKNYNFIVVTFERLAKAQGTLHGLFLESCEAIYDLTELSSHDNILNYLELLNKIYNPEIIWICNGTPWLAENTMNLRELFNNAAIIDQQVYDTEQGWVQLYKKRDAGLLNFDRFIAINSKIKDVFINEAGIREENIDLIYSAMSIEKRQKAIVKNNSELRQKFKLEQDQKYFVFIGRLTRQKAPLDLLKLIKKVVAKYKGEFKFILVGSGELGEQVEKYILDNKLTPFIVRHEFIENTFEVSKVSEAIMFTSLYEGLSIALLEALSVGTPAISTDVGDTKLILDKFENGLVFPKIGDIDGYFSGFEKFIAKSDFYKNNAEKNKEKIAAMFSPSNITSQYATCFENAATTVKSELV